MFESIIFIVILSIIMRIILSPIQKYLNRRAEEKMDLRIENKINSMSMEEKLSILNSDDFKQWRIDIDDLELDDADYSKMIKVYMLHNINRFF